MTNAPLGRNKTPLRLVNSSTKGLNLCLVPNARKNTTAVRGVSNRTGSLFISMNVKLAK